MIKMVFNKELMKEKRVENGLSQQVIADLLGVKAQSVYNWENGINQPSEKNILKLSQVLQTDVTQFLIKKDIIPSQEKKKKINYLLVRTLRQEHNYSQLEFGTLIGISKTTISKWENGNKNISKKNLLKIADLFDRDIEEFYHKE